MNKPDAELYGSVRSMTVEGECEWTDFVNENKHVRPCVFVDDFETISRRILMLELAIKRCSFFLERVSGQK